MNHTSETLPKYPTTIRFEMPHRTMATYLMTLYGRPWLYGAAILTVAAGVAAIFDLRWLIVGLMILLIATPLMLALLYLNYGLRPACVANILPHTIELLPEALCVRVWARSNKKSESSDFVDKSDDLDNSDKSDNSDNAAFANHTVLTTTAGASSLAPPAVTHIFPLDSLRPYSVGLDSVTIPIAGKGFLWLPSSAFSTPDGLTLFTQALSRPCHTAPT